MTAKIINLADYRKSKEAKTTVDTVTIFDLYSLSSNDELFDIWLDRIDGVLKDD